MADKVQDKAQKLQDGAQNKAEDVKGQAQGKAEEFKGVAQEKTNQVKQKLPEPEQAAKTVWSRAKPFVNGGASGMLATCFIQPVDMVKVRLQLGAQGSPVSF